MQINSSPSLKATGDGQKPGAPAEVAPKGTNEAPSGSSLSDAGASLDVFDAVASPGAGAAGAGGGAAPTAQFWGDDNGEIPDSGKGSLGELNASDAGRLQTAPRDARYSDDHMTGEWGVKGTGYSDDHMTGEWGVTANTGTADGGLDTVQSAQAAPLKGLDVFDTGPSPALGTGLRTGNSDDAAGVLSPAGEKVTPAFELEIEGFEAADSPATRSGSELGRKFDFVPEPDFKSDLGDFAQLPDLSAGTDSVFSGSSSADERITFDTGPGDDAFGDG